MAIAVRQDSEPTGSGEWRWRIWLEGDLEDVTSVEYRLHPTFPTPLVTVRDRNAGFLLVRRGWGTFTVGIAISREDGKVEHRRHALVFAQANPRLFVSHAEDVDSELLERVVTIAEEAGWEVAQSDDSVPAGDDILTSLETALSGCDGVFVLESETPSRWALREVQTAQSFGKPIASLGKGLASGRVDAESIGSLEQLPKILGDWQAYRDRMLGES